MFCQKLINSGFSKSSAQLILVHGVARYAEIVKNASLPVDHQKFRSIHFDKFFNRLERKLKKYSDKANWYESDKVKSNWRLKLNNGSLSCQRLNSLPYGKFKIQRIASPS